MNKAPPTMKVLIAEDDESSRKVLVVTLKDLGYNLVTTRDGNEAWQELQKPDPPQLAILDWMMPALDGVSLCRRVRASQKTSLLYIILLTALTSKENIVEGLRAGANDYVGKPFNLNELRARVQVGERVVRLQSELADRVRELEETMAHVKRLQGLLPICAYCKKVRDDKNYWHEVESYFRQFTDIEFSHGICPPCRQDLVLKLNLASTWAQGAASEEPGDTP
jgi:phosphoserine phosphatase RsbU/P